MNFLSEIMATAGKIEMDELREKILQIKEEISTLKLKVNDLVKREYVEFIPLLQDDKNLMSEAVVLSDEMELLSQRIETQVKAEVSECLNEVITLSESYKESKVMLDLLNNLLYIHGILISNSDMHYKESRKEAVLKLIEVSNCLEETRGEFENLEILTAIKAEIDEQRSEYIADNLKSFSNYVMWNEREFSIKSKQVTLSISDKLSDSELFEALNLYDSLAVVTWQFCDKLMKNVLMPIMMSPHTVSVSENKDVQLVIQSESQTVHQETHIKMENLLKVFQFLSKYLSVSVDEEKAFTSKIDDAIAEDFCNLFIKHCVLDSIPFKQKDYQNYEKFMQQILSFESALRKMGFLLNKTTALSSFATNSDEHFSDKSSQVHVSKARDLMKKDLHHMIHITPPILTNDSVTKLNDNSLHQHMDMCDNTFQFPACSISKSTAELMDVLAEIMEDIVESTNTLHAVKLFSAARNIVSMYSDVVPTYHAKMLSSIPQQSALFYNNCFYLAHMSVFLVFEYKPKFPEILESHLVTLVDLVQPLRKTGLSVLSEQQQTQKKQIIDIIKDSGLVTLGDTSVFPVSIEKSIRQCLRQLKLLQSVWQQVLSVTCYVKIMGSISSTLIEELIKCILTLDDIAADVASKLVTIFSIIIDELPRVFPDANEVYRLIKKWGKFVELNKVLGGTLQQIDERWADGKGPLAEEFKAEQVRHLIRALFRNTERRANILARIQVQSSTNSVRS